MHFLICIVINILTNNGPMLSIPIVEKARYLVIIVLLVEVVLCKSKGWRATCDK